MTRIYHNGANVIFHDPGPEMIPYFKALDPNYQLLSERPPVDFEPRFQKLHRQSVATERPILEMSVDELQRLLENDQKKQVQVDGSKEYSKLDVVEALALKSLSDCKLCGWQCGVNRFQEAGRCGLTNKAYHRRPFIHIAEEACINPAIVINLGGCAMRCCDCIDYENWDASSLTPLDINYLWHDIFILSKWKHPLNSLEFANPTESLPTIISALKKAPETFNMPIVFNCHLYGTPAFYEIARHVVDIWLPDLKYGNDNCATKLSGVKNYFNYAKQGLIKMHEQNSKVIVRILVRPGHVECCHRSIVKFLEPYKSKIWLSLLDQYILENMPSRNNMENRFVRSFEANFIEDLIGPDSGFRIITL